jgi:hypothetical protein
VSVISIGGSDWFGIGETGSEAYKGTALCGSRPNCLWTDECKRKVKAFEDCVKTTNEKMFELTAAESEAQRKALEKSEPIKQRNRIIVIALITTAVVILTIVIIRKVRKSRK